MRSSLLPVTVLLCGCYSYAPLQTTAVTPSATVRARISAQEADRLKEILPSLNRVLEGKVVNADAAAIVLEVPSTTITIGTRPLHQIVSISHAGIQELESRQLDRTRTGLAGLAAVTVAGVVIYQGIKGNPGQDGLPGEGTGPEFRTRLRLRR